MVYSCKDGVCTVFKISTLNLLLYNVVFVFQETITAGWSYDTLWGDPSKSCQN